jgi:glycyl-tRNA synthetase beta subunit
LSEIVQHSSEEDQQVDQEQEQELKFYKSAIDWRRNIVLQMLSEGHHQSHISRVLKVHRSTISIDVQYLREEARKQMHEFITERLPMAVAKSCTALDSITSTAWDLARNTDDDRIRLQALTLIKETEKDKIDIVSNVNIVDQIVSEQEKQQQQQNDSVLQLVGELKEEEAEENGLVQPVGEGGEDNA